MSTSGSSIVDAVVAQFRARFGEPELQKQAFRWAIQHARANPSINLWVELSPDGAGAVIWVFDPKNETQPGVNVRVCKLSEVDRAVERVRRQFEGAARVQQSATNSALEP